MAPADPPAVGDAEPSADGAYECARAAVCRVLELPPERVRQDQRLAADLGADSLAIVEIAELTEDEAMRRWRVRARIEDRGLTMTGTVGELAEELWRSMAWPSRAWRTVPRAPQQMREGRR